MDWHGCPSILILIVISLPHSQILLHVPDPLPAQPYQVTERNVVNKSQPSSAFQRSSPPPPNTQIETFLIPNWRPWAPSHPVHPVNPCSISQFLFRRSRTCPAVAPGRSGIHVPFPILPITPILHHSTSPSPLWLTQQRYSGQDFRPRIGLYH